jgi:predicted RecB family nuclease
MRLPEGFVFSQSSLQDYVDCARRFQLRYLEHCSWPGPETADGLEFERHLQRGYGFHRLMRRFHSGVPQKALESSAAVHPDLARWWANYLAAPPQNLPGEVGEAEVTLSTALAGYRLEARYDLLAGQPGQRWVIVDWKTSRRRTSRGWLGQRLQTRIYPLTLVQAGTTFNGGEPIAAEQVEMIYWFAEFPAQPEPFVYNSNAFASDAAFLEGLVRDIEARPEEVFPKTDIRRRCFYCVYRSLCWDDVQAGLLAEAEDVEAVEVGLEDIDLESIAPVPF